MKAKKTLRLVDYRAAREAGFKDGWNAARLVMKEALRAMQLRTIKGER